MAEEIVTGGQGNDGLGTTTTVTTTTAETPVVGGATPLQIKDEDIVEILVDGQKVQKPWKEARGYIMRQEDYTQKTQKVATQAKQVQELFEGLTKREKDILDKETALDRILGRATPADKEPSYQPDDVLTFSQVKALLTEHSKTVAQSVASVIGEQTQASEQARAFQRFDELTSQTVDSLVKENPLLAEIPELAIVLRAKAKEAKPTTEREMIAAIYDSGKKIAAGLESKFVERQKAAALKKAQLASSGPEPRGGTPQFQTQKTYGKGRKINWGEIETDAIAAAEGLDQ